MREPLLHDGKPWPRTLAPEETVIAYLTSSIQSHSVLPSIRFGYALSDRSEIWIGASAAILYFTYLDCADTIGATGSTSRGLGKNTGVSR